MININDGGYSQEYPPATYIVDGMQVQTGQGVSLAEAKAHVESMYGPFINIPNGPEESSLMDTGDGRGFLPVEERRRIMIEEAEAKKAGTFVPFEYGNNNLNFDNVVQDRLYAGYITPNGFVQPQQNYGYNQQPMNYGGYPQMQQPIQQQYYPPVAPQQPVSEYYTNPLINGVPAKDQMNGDKTLGTFNPYPNQSVTTPQFQQPMNYGGYQQPIQSPMYSQMNQPMNYGGYPQMQHPPTYGGGYQQQQYPNQNYGANDLTNYGVNRYYPGFNNGYYGYYNNPLNQFENGFNQVVNQELYTADQWGVDPFECLEGMLTDEEKEYRKLHEPVAYNMYGVPVWTQNQINAAYNADYEKARQQTIKFNIDMYYACTADHKEERLPYEELVLIFDDKARYAHEMKMRNQNTNYTNLTAEQIKFRNDMAEVDATAALHRQFMNVDRVNEYIAQKRIAGWKRIKESHDKILGVKPGEECTFEQYCENFPFLYAEAISRKTKRDRHDGTNKYNQDGYKSRFASNKEKDSFNDNTPISAYIEGGDEYVPLDQRLKQRFNVSKSYLKDNGDGTFSPSTPPPTISDEVRLEREKFLALATTEGRVEYV